MRAFEVTYYGGEVFVTAEYPSAEAMIAADREGFTEGRMKAIPELAEALEKWHRGETLELAWRASAYALSYFHDEPGDPYLNLRDSVEMARRWPGSPACVKVVELWDTLQGFMRDIEEAGYLETGRKQIEGRIEPFHPDVAFGRVGA